MRHWIRLAEAFWDNANFGSDPSGLSAMTLQDALTALERPAPSTAASLLATSHTRHKEANFGFKEAEQARSDWLESHPLAEIVHAEVPFHNYPMSQGKSLDAFLQWVLTIRRPNAENERKAANGNASWTTSHVHTELAASYVEFLGRNSHLRAGIERAADEYAARMLAHAGMKNRIQQTYAASHRDLDTALDAEAKGCTLMWLGHMLWYALDQIAAQDDPEYEQAQWDREEAGYAPEPRMSPESVLQAAISDSGELGKNYANDFISGHMKKMTDGQSVVGICDAIFRRVYGNHEPWWIQGFRKMIELHGPESTLGSLAARGT